MFLPKLQITNTIKSIQTDEIRGLKHFLWTERYVVSGATWPYKQPGWFAQELNFLC